MSTRITRMQGMKFKAESEGLQVISGRIDQNSPPEGMSPGRLLAASLGLCTATHIAPYLDKQQIESKDFSLTVITKPGYTPNRAEEFNITVHLGTALSEKQKRELIEETQRCYVVNTLKNTPKINVTVKTLE